MHASDPFPRRTVTTGGLVTWLAELASTLDGLVSSYRPGRPVDPRTRERIMLAVTEVNGCRYCAFIHGSWSDFLGDVARADADEAVLAYARACAEEGRPLDPSPLHDVLPAEAVRAVRATVAQIEVSNLVGNTVDGLLARLTRKRPLDPVRSMAELGAVLVAAPVGLPLLAVGGLLRRVGRAVPPMPEVTMPPSGQANLLTHLLAQAAPAYLANAGVRAAVLGAPFSLSVALRAGRTTATITVGRGRIEIRNGIAPDAVLVIEGEVGPLLRMATGEIVRELGSVRIRPNP